MKCAKCDSYSGGATLCPACEQKALERVKRCGCCEKVFDTVPEHAKYHVDKECGLTNGYYWNCNCGSTMFIPEAKARYWK